MVLSKKALNIPGGLVFAFGESCIVGWIRI